MERPPTEAAYIIIVSAMPKQTTKVAVLNDTTTSASSLHLSKSRSIPGLRRNSTLVQIRPLQFSNKANDGRNRPVAGLIRPAPKVRGGLQFVKN